uniref:Uncharacterized protein n=1 Tax=Timspurckia oligopyrenoides TaxID=708627 RepID=A0A7S0ZHG0_9RHOD
MMNRSEIRFESDEIHFQVQETSQTESHSNPTLSIPNSINFNLTSNTNSILSNNNNNSQSPTPPSSSSSSPAPSQSSMNPKPYPNGTNGYPRLSWAMGSATTAAMFPSSSNSDSSTPTLSTSHTISSFNSIPSSLRNVIFVSIFTLIGSRYSTYYSTTANSIMKYAWRTILRK